MRNEKKTEAQTEKHGWDKVRILNEFMDGFNYVQTGGIFDFDE
jgi:hypothetical protein